MILITDSGGTKTAWACIGEDIKRCIQPIYINSLGINPIRDSKECISEAVNQAKYALQQSSLQEGSNTINPKEIHHIFFYGSGCISPYSDIVKEVLQTAYPNATILVESDMLGAALALCGHNEGIACILGTGSNSCLFDGEKIVMQTPALGFIIGDEGSGASLGKSLVGDILKHQLPQPIQEAFFKETGLTQAEIINRVYRQPQPNMFLASLTKFLSAHLDNDAIHNLVVNEFRRFLQRNILNYQRPDLPIHFVGGIPEPFKKELNEAITKEGLIMGKILSKPIVGMVNYHTSFENMSNNI